MDLPLAAEVGFAEFVGKLLSEVFDSVVTAQIDQERRLAEVLDAAGRTPEEVAARFLSDDAVEAELVRLFPGRAIVAGGFYRPAGATGGEEPPFTAELGLALDAGTDFQPAAGGALLTAAGAERVRAAVRLRLATDQLSALRQLAALGFPRLVVEGGKVNAKLTFQLGSPAAPVVPAASSAVARQRFAAPAHRLIAPAELPALRLAVRPVSDRAPQATQLQINVYSEVEVRFKTVL